MHQCESGLITGARLGGSAAVECAGVSGTVPHRVPEIFADPFANSQMCRCAGVLEGVISRHPPPDRLHISAPGAYRCKAPSISLSRYPFPVFSPKRSDFGGIPSSRI